MTPGFPMLLPGNDYGRKTRSGKSPNRRREKRVAPRKQLPAGPGGKEPVGFRLQRAGELRLKKEGAAGLFKRVKPGKEWICCHKELLVQP